MGAAGDSGLVMVLTLIHWLLDKHFLLEARNNFASRLPLPKNHPPEVDQKEAVDG